MKINKTASRLYPRLKFLKKKANGMYMFSKQGHMFVTGLREDQLFTTACLKAHMCMHTPLH